MIHLEEKFYKISCNSFSSTAIKFKRPLKNVFFIFFDKKQPIY